MHEPQELLHATVQRQLKEIAAKLARRVKRTKSFYPLLRNRAEANELFIDLALAFEVFQSAWKAALGDDRVADQDVPVTSPLTEPDDPADACPVCGNARIEDQPTCGSTVCQLKHAPEWSHN